MKFTFCIAILFNCISKLSRVLSLVNIVQRDFDVVNERSLLIDHSVRKQIVFCNAFLYFFPEIEYLNSLQSELDFTRNLITLHLSFVATRSEKRLGNRKDRTLLH